MVTILGMVKKGFSALCVGTLVYLLASCHQGQAPVIFPSGTLVVPQSFIPVPITTRWNMSYHQILVQVVPASAVSSVGQTIVQVFDIESNQILFTLQDQNQPEVVNTAEFSSDGTFIVTTGQRGVIVWNAITGEKITQLFDKNTYFLGAYFLPDNSRIITYKEILHELVLWNFKTGSVDSWISNSLENATLQLSSDGKKAILLNSTIENASIDIIDIDSKIVLFSHRLADSEWKPDPSQGSVWVSVFLKAISPSARYAVFGYQVNVTNPMNASVPTKNILFVWDTATRSLLHQTALYSAIANLQFSSDETQVSFLGLSSAGTLDVQTLEVATGKNLSTLTFESMSRIQLCSQLFFVEKWLSSDAEKLNLSHVWRLSSQNEIVRLRVRERENFFFQFDPIGVVSPPICSPDGTQILWWIQYFSNTEKSSHPNSGIVKGYLWDVQGV